MPKTNQSIGYETMIRKVTQPPDNSVCMLFNYTEKFTILKCSLKKDYTTVYQCYVHNLFAKQLLEVAKDN